MKKRRLFSPSIRLREENIFHLKEDIPSFFQLQNRAVEVLVYLPWETGTRRRILVEFSLIILLSTLRCAEGPGKTIVTNSSLPSEGELLI